MHRLDRRAHCSSSMFDSATQEFSIATGRRLGRWDLCRGITPGAGVNRSETYEPDCNYVSRCLPRPNYTDVLWMTDTPVRCLGL